MFARWGRWQPMQLGFHDEWHAMQLMLPSLWAVHASPPTGTVPHFIRSPSNRTVLARADFALYRACVGSIVSFTWTTSHRTPFSTDAFWKMRFLPLPSS